jgi:predicted 2-oxoglutarate/Fe(II)-dependent dioxygenase YbiX
MNIVDDFNDKYYVVLKNLIDKQTCDSSVMRLFDLVSKKQTVNDSQCPSSDAVYCDPYFDQLLNDLTETFSEISDRQLIPTYSYARVYRPGEILTIHRDRPACEISATVTLGLSGKEWPISFNKENSTENGNAVILEPGDVALYKGTEIYHWRNSFEGEWQCQVFFHYVDANGPHANQKYDGRSSLNVSSETQRVVHAKQEDSVIYFWQFPNVISKEYCDSIILKYGSSELEDAEIGGHINGVINKQIRNVKRMLLPIHEGIGTQLISNAFVANQQAWKFDLTQCQQIEYLKYNETGRYRSHLDTFITTPTKECRKLTALAFLNDDFEGGKFFLQVSDEKLYPLQTKGTVIVFPSFLLHGVEDVISGTRHATVCWMIGPYFR